MWILHFVTHIQCACLNCCASIAFWHLMNLGGMLFCKPMSVSLWAWVGTNILQYIFTVTIIFFKIYFQCSKIFSNNTSVFYHLNRIIKYLTMSFVAIITVIKFNIPTKWTCQQNTNLIVILVVKYYNFLYNTKILW